MLPPRLHRLPTVPLAGPLACHDVRLAAGPRARLLGLAGLRSLPRGCGLLLPRTRSIHTFGMRFALDLVWLDGAGRLLRIDREVRPRRLHGCRDARMVVELPGGTMTRSQPRDDAAPGCVLFPLTGEST